MSDKFKRLVRQTMARTGVSHQGAVNILRKGGFRPLDAVQTSDHQAGLVSAVLPDGRVILTPARPVHTADGVWLDPEDQLVLCDVREVKPYPLKKDERWARFVEDLFEPVTEQNVAQYEGVVWKNRDGCSYLFSKEPEEPALIFGEEGDHVLSVTRPRRVIVALQPFRANLVINGETVGQDAVKIWRALRDRMVAIVGATLFTGHGIVSKPEWYLDPTGNGQLLSNLPDSDKAYACGSGSIGLHPQDDSFHGLIAWSRKVGFTEDTQPLAEEPLRLPVERVHHNSVLEMLRAVQEQAAEQRVSVFTADQPSERLLGFIVRYQETEQLHLAPVQLAHDIQPGTLHTMMLTLNGRRQIAHWLQLGVNVLSERDLRSAPLTVS